MLRLTITLFVIALIAAFLGFGGIASESAYLAKIAFFIFLALALVSFVMGRTRTV